jgi:hypothetical protein
VKEAIHSGRIEPLVSAIEKGDLEPIRIHQNKESGPTRILRGNVDHCSGAINSVMGSSVQKGNVHVHFAFTETATL